MTFYLGLWLMLFKISMTYLIEHFFHVINSVVLIWFGIEFKWNIKRENEWSENERIENTKEFFRRNKFMSSVCPRYKACYICLMTFDFSFYSLIIFENKESNSILQSSLCNFQLSLRIFFSIFIVVLLWTLIKTLFSTVIITWILILYAYNFCSKVKLIYVCTISG